MLTPLAGLQTYCDKAEYERPQLIREVTETREREVNVRRLVTAEVWCLDLGEP